MSYAALIPYATPGFIAFGLGSLPAGWIADKWSREGMLVLFFVGIGASSILTALADSPMQIALGLLAIGAFASIYHPVGLAMVVHGRKKTGVPLAVNGVFGNLGVATAALLTGTLIDTGGWRSAFILPGAVSIGLGAAYAVFVRGARGGRNVFPGDPGVAEEAGETVSPVDRPTFVRVLSVIVFTAAVGGLIYQSTTFALPKIFDERLANSPARHRDRGLCIRGVRDRGAGATRGRVSRGPLRRAHRVRIRRGPPGGLLRAHVRAHRHGGRGCRDRLHFRRLRADPHQRRAREPHRQERVAKPRLCRSLRRVLLGDGLQPAGHRRNPRGMGLRRALRRNGRCGGRHPRRGPHAAATGGTAGRTVSGRCGTVARPRPDRDHRLTGFECSRSRENAQNTGPAECSRREPNSKWPRAASRKRTSKRTLNVKTADGGHAGAKRLRLELAMRAPKRWPSWLARGSERSRRPKRASRGGGCPPIWRRIIAPS